MNPRTILAIAVSIAGLVLGLTLLVLRASSLPAVEIEEGKSTLYSNPEKVEIVGYDDDCMEPFITRNGMYLLFNNSNAPGVDTHLHLAKRIDKLRFQHIGVLPGSVSDNKDMAPTADVDGKLYFTSLRSYPADGHSIYAGDFADEKLDGVKAANIEIMRAPGLINMDCDISPDGMNLIFSRARFEPLKVVPSESDLLMYKNVGNGFVTDAQYISMCKNLNTKALEYAPATTIDGRELYFTRANQKLVQGSSQGPYLRIMVATRKKTNEPFGVPKVLSDIQGFVEAPTVSLDKSEMFFHKKDGEKFSIYRATRAEGINLLRSAKAFRLQEGAGLGSRLVNEQDKQFGTIKEWIRTSYFDTGNINRMQGRLPVKAWGRSLSVYSAPSGSNGTLLVRLPMNTDILDMDQTACNAEYERLENIFKEAGRPYISGTAAADD